MHMTETDFTLNHAMTYLVRALITKTGEAPGTINRLVRSRLYPLLRAFAAKKPAHLRELARRVDFIRPDPSAKSHVGTDWYLARARQEILTFGDELLKREPASPALRELTAGIGRVV